MLVGTYRDVELSRQHPLAEALGELNRERLFQRVLLRGLAQQYAPISRTRKRGVRTATPHNGRNHSNFELAVGYGFAKCTITFRKGGLGGFGPHTTNTLQPIHPLPPRPYQPGPRP